MLTIRSRRTAAGLAVTAAVALSAVAPATSSALLARGQMIVYQAGKAIPEDQLQDLGAPEGLGGTVVSGDPRISARIDHALGSVLAGVFQATRGTVLIHFPFTEHATIITGAVKLTDSYGNSATLHKGDSYFIHQGSDILWEVSGPRVQKSFFNTTEQEDSPAPMLIYRKGKPVPQSELQDLGAPEDLGGTTLEGDPHISARVDYANGPFLAGVFQATRGDVMIDFPFTEHATISEHTVTLTDETGAKEKLSPGDSYLIKEHSQILWQVSDQRVQKSFFNGVE